VSGGSVSPHNYEIASGGDNPVMEDWETEGYLRYVATVFKGIRAEFGLVLDFWRDRCRRMTPTQAP
jgi:hypothetical protein